MRLKSKLPLLLAHSRLTCTPSKSRAKFAQPSLRFSGISPLIEHARLESRANQRKLGTKGSRIRTAAKPMLHGAAARHVAVLLLLRYKVKAAIGSRRRAERIRCKPEHYQTAVQSALVRRAGLRRLRIAVGEAALGAFVEVARRLPGVPVLVGTEAAPSLA